LFYDSRFKGFINFHYMPAKRRQYTNKEDTFPYLE